MEKKRKKAQKVVKNTQKTEEKPVREKNSGFKTFLRILLLVIWVGGVYFLVQLLLLFLFKTLFKDSVDTPLLQTICDLLCYGISAVIIVFVPKLIKRKWGTSLEELGIIEMPTWTDIGLAPVGFIIYMVLAGAITTIFTHFSWFEAAEEQDVGFSTTVYGIDRILALVTLVVIAPIAEEIIFRGFLYGKLRKNLVKEEDEKNKRVRGKKAKYWLGVLAATLITSALFGFMHGQWNIGVNVFALSIVLCAFREMTGTIYAGILVHMLKNAVAFYLLYVLGVG